MPTRMRSPSCLAHSCSWVYLSSAGTFAIKSSAADEKGHLALFYRPAVLSALLAFDFRGVEGGADDAGWPGGAADLHGDLGADGGVRGLHVGQRDRPVDGRTV